jgi:hypothetical protein
MMLKQGCLIKDSETGKTYQLGQQQGATSALLAWPAGESPDAQGVPSAEIGPGKRYVPLGLPVDYALPEGWWLEAQGFHGEDGSHRQVMTNGGHRVTWVSKDDEHEAIDENGRVLARFGKFINGDDILAVIRRVTAP